jgi:hypothetical protein
MRDVIERLVELFDSGELCSKHQFAVRLLLIPSVRTVVEVATPIMDVLQFVVRSADGAIPPAVAEAT